MTTQTAAPGMSKTATGLVMTAGLLTMLMAILDNTIVTTTAVPIAQALQPRGGAAAIPWLVTAYALASTVVQPLYGKLADSFGVRPVMIATLTVFLAGSLLCGLAQSMQELVLFRALQGLGGGGLMSVTMVLIGQLRADSGEANAGGGSNAIAAAMVGLGIVLGPLVGGLLVNALGWPWVFLFNVPLGLAALVIFIVALRMPAPKQPGGPGQRSGLELPSAGLLALSAAAVIVLCQFGGHQFAWGSWQTIGTIVLAVTALVAFVWRQRTARDPFFPPRLLRHPGLRIITVLQFASGLGFGAGIVYLTLELQLVRGATPVQTGLQMLPLAFGLGAGAFAGSRLVKHRRPLRTSIALGSAVSALALAGFALCTAATPLVLLWALMTLFGVGLGLGLGNEFFLLFAMVERRDLGIATTGIRFVETLGTSLGATVFATVFGALVPAGAGIDVTARAIDLIFLLGAGAVAASAIVALRLPRDARA
ncbi:hypothetical protein GCM10028798_21220 [Humibacter antri]